MKFKSELSLIIEREMVNMDSQYLPKAEDLRAMKKQGDDLSVVLIILTYIFASIAVLLSLPYVMPGSHFSTYKSFGVYEIIFFSSLVPVCYIFYLFHRMNFLDSFEKRIEEKVSIMSELVIDSLNKIIKETQWINSTYPVNFDDINIKSLYNRNSEKLLSENEMK